MLTSEAYKIYHNTVLNLPLADQDSGDEMTLARDFLTITQASEKLKVNRATLRRWIEEGRLSAETIGRERLISRREVDLLEGIPTNELVLAVAAMEDLGIDDVFGARFAPSGYGAAKSDDGMPRYLAMLADGRRKIVRVRLEEVEDVTDTW